MAVTIIYLFIFLIREVKFIVSVFERTTKTGSGQNRLLLHIGTTAKSQLREFWFDLLQMALRNCVLVSASYKMI